MVRLRLITMGLAALICISIVYVALTNRFSAITDMFEDTEAIKVEVEEKEKPPPPPPPPPDRPPPPPPPEQRIPPPMVDVPQVATDLPVAVDPPPAPPVSVITNPQWIERPNGRDFAREYPERALEREREGRVTLNCVVNANGRISCTVATEDPEGWGFGQAAVRISRSFRIAPRLENGQPTEGGRLTVPITFRLGG